MKKVMHFIKTHSLSLLTALALVVGTTSASANTMLFIHQVKCPEELLK